MMIFQPGDLPEMLYVTTTRNWFVMDADDCDAFLAHIVCFYFYAVCGIDFFM